MKDCHAEEPSKVAASYWSFGTVCNAERTLTIISGAPNQILINTIVRKTNPPSVKNCGAAPHKPILTRKLGKNPDTPFKIHFQDRAITIVGNAQGTMSSVRYIDLHFRTLSKANAAVNPTRICPAKDTIVHLTLLKNERQKSWSVKMAM